MATYAGYAMGTALLALILTLLSVFMVNMARKNQGKKKIGYLIPLVITLLIFMVLIYIRPDMKQIPKEVIDAYFMYLSATGGCFLYWISSVITKSRKSKTPPIPK